jgi:hypothetical protein
MILAMMVCSTRSPSAITRVDISYTRIKDYKIPQLESSKVGHEPLGMIPLSSISNIRCYDSFY